MDNSGSYLFLLVIWLLIALFGMGLADDKGRSKLMGFLVAGVFGLLGLFVLAVLPATAEKKAERRIAKGLAKACPHCYSVVDVRAAVCPQCQRELK